MASVAYGLLWLGGLEELQQKLQLSLMILTRII